MWALASCCSGFCGCIAGAAFGPDVKSRPISGVENTDPDPEYAPVIIRNNRLHVGCIFRQPADFSANSDGVIQPSAEWGRLWL